MGATFKWCLEFVSLEAGGTQAIEFEAGVVTFAPGRRVQPHRLVDFPGKQIERGPYGRAGGVCLCTVWCYIAPCLGLV